MLVATDCELTSSSTLETSDKFEIDDVTVTLPLTVWPLSGAVSVIVGAVVSVVVQLLPVPVGAQLSLKNKTRSTLTPLACPAMVMV